MDTAASERLKNPVSLPKVLGIGAQKAATSWLHENIGANPGAWVPPFKELHFFDHKFIPANRRWTAWHVKRGIAEARKRAHANQDEYLTYLDSLEKPPLLNGTWYKRVFSQCPHNAIGFDVTPEYSSLPKEGIEFALRFLGRGVRAIYIIRDPVERALSQIAMNVRRAGAAPLAHCDWIALAEAADVVDRGNYIRNVSNWDACIGTDRICYISFKRIELEPLTVLRELELFCGLPPFHYPNASRKVFPRGNVEIPDFVKDHLRDLLAPQIDFIRKRFGENFG